MNYIKMAPIQGLAGMGGGALSLGIAASGPTLTNLGNRAVVVGGNTAFPTNAMDYFAIDSTGNASDFGDLNTHMRNGDACSDGSRGVLMGGRDTGANWKEMQYWTFANTGNAADMGDLTTGRGYNPQSGNGTRGISASGQPYSGGESNIIDYIVIQNTANAIDFGDMTSPDRRGAGATSNLTQMLVGGGYDGSSRINNIDKITMDTTGNSSDFGDLTNDAAWSKCGIPEYEIDRGIFGGGNNASGTYIDHIEYVSFGSNANTSDFGNLSVARQHLTGTSNNTRGVFIGGYNPSYNNQGQNTIDYITIASTGNASDFGDLSQNAYGQGASSGD